MIGKMAKASFIRKQNRDGQSPDSALFVTGVSGSDIGDATKSVLTESILKTILTSTLSFLTGPVGLTILGGAALFTVMKTLMEKNSDKEGVDLATKSLGGTLDESQIGSSIMDAAEEGERQREEAAKEAAKKAKQEQEAKAATERLKNLPDTGAGGGRGFVNPTMPTGAGGGRGFVNPELVTPEAEAIPSNVVRTASGEAIRSGSGGYVTSVS